MSVGTVRDRGSPGGDALPNTARSGSPPTLEGTTTPRVPITDGSPRPPQPEGKPVLRIFGADSSTTQESVSPQFDAEQIDRAHFLERRIFVLEEENAQLQARVRLTEKGVEEARRLAMASAIFALGAMLVAKLLAH